MHACVIPQLLGELKPIGSLSASQLSCNSAGLTQPQMALVDYERPSRAQSTEALRFSFSGGSIRPWPRSWGDHALPKVTRCSVSWVQFQGGTQQDPISEWVPLLQGHGFEHVCMHLLFVFLSMGAWFEIDESSYLFVSWLDSLINY